MDVKLRNLIISLHEIGAISFQPTKLKSGIVSPIYFDLRGVISYPAIMQNLCEILEEAVSKHASEVDVLCGVPYTALPWATLVSVKHNIPMIIKRKEKKEYGTGKLIEGSYTKNKTRCLILEDVVTTGSSVLETAHALRDEQIKVSRAIVVLNRNPTEVSKTLDQEKISLETLIQVDQMLDVLHKAGCITAAQKLEAETFMENDQKVPAATVLEKVSNGNAFKCSNGMNGQAKWLCEIMIKKQTNLCLSADLTDWQKILLVTETVASSICALKTHLDATNFKDLGEVEHFTTELKRLAKEHEFAIIEDRKFADIGSTVEKQVAAQPLGVGDWAHFVTAHAVAGSGMLKAFQAKHLGVILIAEMSSEGNIPASLPGYKEKVWEMRKGFEDTVVGFVSQSPLGGGNITEEEKGSYLQFTPGVNLDSTGDSLGQKYVGVKEAVVDRGADVIIVGRGIINQEEGMWKQVAEKYRQQGWEAWQQKHKLA